MSTEKNLLVGVDYSTHSQNALREAARIANAHEYTLICYHVLDKDILESFRKMEAYTEEGVLNFANEKIADFIRETIGTAHRVEAQVYIGHPFEVTLKLIEQFKPVSLVLGSRGLSSGEQSHVGALASRCIRKAPVEVLLVRGFHDRPFERIVACVDFSENSLRAAHRAAELAKQDKAHLQLIHINQSPVYTDQSFGWLGPALPVSPPDDLEANLKERLEEVASDLAERCSLPTRPSTQVVSSMSVHEGIYQDLKNEKADLIVMGTRGRTGFKKLLLGTTAEKLIYQTPCSTLAVKPADFTFSLH